MQDTRNYAYLTESLSTDGDMYICTHIIPIPYRHRVDTSLNRAGIRHEADYANNSCASAKVCPIHEFMHGCMNYTYLMHRNNGQYNYTQFTELVYVSQNGCGSCSKAVLDTAAVKAKHPCGVRGGW